MQHDHSFLETLDCGDLYLRRNFIGASDAPIIMGVSPWRKPIDLYREKSGLVAPQEENKYMQWGKIKEGEARLKFEELCGVKVPPKRLFSENYPWMMASLDGLSEDGKVALEIKCPQKISYDCKSMGKVPEKYYPQVQHQMYVAGLTGMYYFEWTEEDYALFLVEFNAPYVEKMIEKEIAFWECLQKKEEPPSDFEEKNDEFWKSLQRMWVIAQESKKNALEYEEGLRQLIIEHCKGKNSRGSGMSAKKIIKAGAINYQSIPELKGIDLEKHRKPGSEYWRITLEGQENGN